MRRAEKENGAGVILSRRRRNGTRIIDTNRRVEFELSRTKGRCSRTEQQARVIDKNRTTGISCQEVEQKGRTRFVN